MAQKQRRQDKCSKCHCTLDNSNNGPHAYTEHHIWPKRHYNSIGPTEVLCRNCHDLAEKVLESAEGGKKHKLDKETYWMLHRNFMKDNWDVKNKRN